MTGMRHESDTAVAPRFDTWASATGLSGGRDGSAIIGGALAGVHRGVFDLRSVSRHVPAGGTWPPSTFWGLLNFRPFPPVGWIFSLRKGLLMPRRSLFVDRFVERTAVGRRVLAPA